MKTLLIAVLITLPAHAADLRVTLYDRAHLNPGVIRATVERLRQIFDPAGIHIEVVAGDLTAPEASLITMPEPPRPGMERVAACRARRDVALEVLGETPAIRKATYLGMAEPLARSGLNARVFHDRIRRLAEQQGRDHAALLAHAIAHEIGHVLLRTAGHSRTGLMSAVWTDREYDLLARGLLTFSREQGRTMSDALIGANCGGEGSISAAYVGVAPPFNRVAPK